MNKKEIRCLDVNLETRDNENDEMTLEGYAITFNSPATHGWTEIISSKALDNTDMTDVVLRYNHNDSFICLARTRNKSLTLTIDEKGLKIKAQLNANIQEHKNIYEAVKTGLIDKMSFAFTVREDEYDYDTDTRTILDIDKLYDVAVVDQPFYDSTSVYARSLEQTKNYIKELREEKENEETSKTELNSAKKELLKILG